MREAGFVIVVTPYDQRKIAVASLALVRSMRNSRIDVVHCADYLAAHYTARAGSFARKPVICHVRNSLPTISCRDATFIYPVNKFVFVSKKTWRNFPFRVREERGGVVYDGIDVPPVAPAQDSRSVMHDLGVPDAVTIVGMVARVAHQKDFETLIKAAARVVPTYPNVRFVIVGDNSRAASYRDGWLGRRA